MEPHRQQPADVSTALVDVVADATSNAPPPGNILDELPGELRNRIFQYVVVSDKPIDIISWRVPKRNRDITPQPAIARTCKAFRHEALSIYYAENSFNITNRRSQMGAQGDFTQVQIWPTRLGKYAKYLTTITIDAAIHGEIDGVYEGSSGLARYSGDVGTWVTRFTIQLELRKTGLVRKVNVYTSTDGDSEELIRGCACETRAQAECRQSEGGETKVIDAFMEMCRKCSEYAFHLLSACKDCGGLRS